MKVFKSEVSYGFIFGLAVFLFGISFLTGLGSAPQSTIVTVCSINLVTILFIWYIFHSIKYTISEGYLKVVCGFLCKKQIPVDTIKSIKKTNSLISSPTASLAKRIQIGYGTYGIIVISPENRMDFIGMLQKANPRIEVSA
ncbi:PH domain-containing protein [Hyunsoonleella sp. SJ7]|uniref:PH domain-containing protein n=1 Tax=Hyunsoonleella aquatilis TaxID=2762758 RepID=A0A923HFU3_9FLAO|nr:PH domain-containing protein [Hyunsoonleella aquatilis]MBC3757667.1 PH domain-containing protein [Hyunsoonleella aquatilis]